MGWTKGAAAGRPRLEEATASVPLLRDVWQKVRLLLVHVTGTNTMVVNMTTEQAQQRATLERLTNEIAGLRADLAAFRREMGEA